MPFAALPPARHNCCLQFSVPYVFAVVVTIASLLNLDPVTKGRLICLKDGSDIERWGSEDILYHVSDTDLLLEALYIYTRPADNWYYIEYRIVNACC